MTRSKPLRLSAAASTGEVAIASEPCSASSTRWIALSAPIDSALRIVSLAARAHGQDRDLATVRLFICRASSIAYSSISL